MFNILEKLVPETGRYLHNAEGPDDAVSHAKSVLTGNTITLPISNGRLNLGTWQGIWLCEFRNGRQSRSIVATINGEEN